MVTVGVLALQGGFAEHLTLLRKAASHYPPTTSSTFSFIQVKTPGQLSQCDALIIPGGESTTMALVAAQSGLLDPLRRFVKLQRKPTWGTCAGLILLSEAANATKKGGQDLIGGLAVRVHRNHFGRQIESFQADLDLPFLSSPSSSSTVPTASPDRSNPFPGVFIRAPVVEAVLSDTTTSTPSSPPTEEIVSAPQVQTDTPQGKVEVLAKLPGRVNKMKQGMSQATTAGDAGDIIAVRQGNVVGTSFHPELTPDERIHVWWLGEVLKSMGH